MFIRLGACARAASSSARRALSPQRMGRRAGPDHRRKAARSLQGKFHDDLSNSSLPSGSRARRGAPRALVTFAEGEEVAQCATKWIAAKENPKFYQPWGITSTTARRSSPPSRPGRPPPSRRLSPETKKAEPPKAAPAAAAPATAPGAPAGGSGKTRQTRAQAQEAGSAQAAVSHAARRNRLRSLPLAGEVGWGP